MQNLYFCNGEMKQDLHKNDSNVIHYLQYSTCFCAVLNFGGTKQYKYIFKIVLFFSPSSPLHTITSCRRSNLFFIRIWLILCSFICFLPLLQTKKGRVKGSRRLFCHREASLRCLDGLACYASDVRSCSSLRNLRGSTERFLRRGSLSFQNG